MFHNLEGQAGACLCPVLSSGDSGIEREQERRYPRNIRVFGSGWIDGSKDTQTLAYTYTQVHTHRHTHVHTRTYAHTDTHT